MKNITIALAGNPNSGKTTIFNSLTGARQHVGNYPGVTVEKKEGKLVYGDYDINVVDLPGIYGLTAYSLDEIVARNFVLKEKPDVVIDIVDSSNLERNLYLAVQFMELGVPLVLAFNMSDLAKKQGFAIDYKKISELLGIPVIPTIATKKEGIDELLKTAVETAKGISKQKMAKISYGADIEAELKKIEEVISSEQNIVNTYPRRWLAVKLLEKDKAVFEHLQALVHYSQIKEAVEKSRRHLKSVLGEEAEALIADARYGFISGVCSEAVKRNYEVRHTISDKIDKVLINRVLGLPIFLVLMWAVFKFTFTFSSPLMSWIEAGQKWLGNFVGGFLPYGGPWRSLVVDGVIGGVGSVLVFLPIIILLFLALALLENTGYMARAAFIMDRFMHKIGLHGRSFIPMLLGFGCNLPAIMATRTIDDERDRLTTILVIPFMSCGARLPVYTLFIAAFFPQRLAGNILFSLYILGVAVAVVMAKIFRKFLFKGEAAPFVMELPPYRLPTIKGLFVHMWERAKIYVKKAGTVIFAGCLLVWFLSNFPRPISSDTPVSNQASVYLNEKAILENSYAARLGKAIAPAFKPLGLDDWRLSVGLIGGFVAKEIVVGTLGTLYSGENTTHKVENLRQILRQQKRPDGSKLYTPLSAYALMVFILLYVPCIATIAVIKRETNSWRWPLFAFFYTTAIAWVLAFLVYQGGKLLGFH